jgi:2-polyprenyl-3-methyl-5-hydroxy-6-metoxy-1,4-benzoquinol methylase
MVQCGLRDSMSFVDVGCGSGRLAYALRDMKISYLGTDVVPELVAYAVRLCDQPRLALRDRVVIDDSCS